MTFIPTVNTLQSKIVIAKSQCIVFGQLQLLTPLHILLPLHTFLSAWLWCCFYQCVLTGTEIFKLKDTNEICVLLLWKMKRSINPWKVNGFTQSCSIFTLIIEKIELHYLPSANEKSKTKMKLYYSRIWRLAYWTNILLKNYDQ